MLPDGVLGDRGAFERYCDTMARATAKVLGEYEIVLDPKDESITPHLVRDGYWEAWVSLAIARHVKRGMWCVDGGANVGYFSLLMVARGAWRVAAVEPSPDTSEFLEETVKLNRLGDRIVVYRVALGSALLTADLLRFGVLHGSDSLVRSHGYEVTEIFRVEIMPLDIIVDAWPRVDFVKLDVEGYEEDAWDGMALMRKRHPDFVACMEVSLRPGFDARAFLSRLAEEKHLGIVNEDGSISPVMPDEFVAHPMTVKHGYGTAWLT